MDRFPIICCALPIASLLAIGYRLHKIRCCRFSVKIMAPAAATAGRRSADFIDTLAISNPPVDPAFTAITTALCEGTVLAPLLNNSVHHHLLNQLPQLPRPTPAPPPPHRLLHRRPLPLGPPRRLVRARRADHDPLPAVCVRRDAVHGPVDAADDRGRGRRRRRRVPVVAVATLDRVVARRRRQRRPGRRRRRGAEARGRGRVRVARVPGEDGVQEGTGFARRHCTARSDRQPDRNYQGAAGTHLAPRRQLQQLDRLARVRAGPAGSNEGPRRVQGVSDRRDGGVEDSRRRLFLLDFELYYERILDIMGRFVCGEAFFSWNENGVSVFLKERSIENSLWEVSTSLKQNCEVR